MKNFIQMTTLLVAGLAMAAPGCKKKEDDKKAPEKAEKVATNPDKTPTPTEEPPPAADTVDPVAKFSACWAAWNARDEAGFKACYGEKSTLTTADAPPVLTGADAIMGNTQKFWTAFPDMKGESHLVLSNGDKMASLTFVSGTNTGPMMMPDGSEMPATNKKTSSYGIQSFDVSDAANMQETDYWDMGLLMGQLTGAEGTRPVSESTGAIEDAPVVATGSEVEKANVEAMSKALAGFKDATAEQVTAGFADDAVRYYTGAPVDLVGPEQITPFMAGFKTAFPDMSIDVEEIWGAGDYVYMSATISGTNTGALPPMLPKPTGKPVKLALAEIYKFTDGKISQQWVVTNGMAMAMQLGLMGEK